MRAPVSWLGEYVDAPDDPEVVANALVRIGLEVEEVIDLRETVTGPLVVGRVLEIDELTEFKKPIRHCMVDVGDRGSKPGEPQSVVCGATNFVAGDLVVVALPGAVLPGDFAISSRKTYGKLSDGMICSARELGIGDDHTGIIVLPPDTAVDDVPIQPGDDAKPVVGLDDVVIDMSVTPDRGYEFAIRGVARELAHSLRLPYTDPAADITPVIPAAGGYPVTVLDERGCDRFVAVTVRGVDPTADSPQWMKTRLVHAGMRPISLIVDITNYVMLDLGQPMHAFDLNRLRGPLVVRRAQDGETLATLDGTKRTLDHDDIVIADDSGVVSLAAVMGGASTEVADDTTDVLFEAAHWAPLAIAHTARRHKLPSEASKRFERGVDPELPLVAAARAIELLTHYGGGTVDHGVTDVNTVTPRADIRMVTDHPSRVAGVDYPADLAARLLTELGCVVEETPSTDGHAAVLRVTPPSWRPDLNEPIELVEEVIRLAGYDEVPSELPPVQPSRGLTLDQLRRRTVGRALAEFGLVEIISNPFLASGVFDALGLDADDLRRVAVRLANPLSEEEPLLRTTLLPGLAATLRRNFGRGTRDVALYETGLVFLPAVDAPAPPVLAVDRRPSNAELAALDAALPAQPRHVGAIYSGEFEPGGWWGPARAASWADAIEAARVTVVAAGETPTVRATTRAPWHPGRCAEIVVADPEAPDGGGVVVGYAGELHPAVCEALGIPARTSAMELNLDAIPFPDPIESPSLSTYPPALIDVALVVDDAVPAEDVQAALVEGAGPLLETIRLFDLYTSDALGAGRKSLAYNLTFRATDRTLTGEEAVAARDAAVAVAAQRFGATLRA